MHRKLHFRLQRGSYNDPRVYSTGCRKIHEGYLDLDRSQTHRLTLSFVDLFLLRRISWTLTVFRSSKANYLFTRVNYPLQPDGINNWRFQAKFYKTIFATSLFFSSLFFFDLQSHSMRFPNASFLDSCDTL